MPPWPRAGRCATPASASARCWHRLPERCSRPCAASPRHRFELSAVGWPRLVGPPARPPAPPSIHDAARGRRAGSAPGCDGLLRRECHLRVLPQRPRGRAPLVLVTQLHASPVWAGSLSDKHGARGRLPVPVTRWALRYSRRTALALSGSCSLCPTCLLPASARPRMGRPAVTGVSVICTLGEIIYAGTSTALVATSRRSTGSGGPLARFQLIHRPRPSRLPSRHYHPRHPRPSALWVIAHRRHPALRSRCHTLNGNLSQAFDLAAR